MVQSAGRTATLEQFLALPETEPASEFSHGNARQKPMPQGRHSYLQLELASLINQSLRRPKIARAGTELRCTFGDRSIVPDIAVFSWDRIPRDRDGRVSNRFDGAPDWTIEILSIGQPSLRPTKNILHCLEHGCELGWLIDPEDLTVLVYAPDAGTRCFERPDDRLPVPGFAERLTLTIQDLADCLVN
ncbi:MAG: Uma2 family endonuclease [Geitlerinemataceae cyanobacterium]